MMIESIFFQNIVKYKLEDCLINFKRSKTKAQNLTKVF